ncbi:hypothetical protein M3J09_013884 [Ascochyta lentis]
MTALDALVRSLARAFEDAGSTSKTALRKVLHEHVRRLIPLRSVANDGELESFYTVAAWYLTKPYLLKQDCITKQDFADDDARIIDESRRIKAITTLNQTWGAKAITQIRKDVRDPLPLPTIPARDFLEALVKIATKVTLNKFLQYFPPFVSDRLHSWRTEAQFHSQELQPCLQYRHIDAFYRDWYAPRFLQHGAIEHPSKRQKTSAHQRRTRTTTRPASQDEQVELPRRASLPELADGDTVIQENSPALSPWTNSTHQSRPSNASTGSQDHTALDDTALDNTALDDTALDNTALDNTALDNTTTEDSELPLHLGQSILDEGLQHQDFDDEETQASTEAANRAETPAANRINTALADPVDTASADATMARRRAPSLSEIRSTKLVQGKYDSLQQMGGFTHALQAIKWSIDSAKQLEQLKTAKAASKEALITAENELQELEEHVSERLPAGKNLDQATCELQANISRLDRIIDRLTAIQHEVAQEIAPGLADLKIEGSADLTSFDSTLTSANTARTSKEQQLEELEQFAEQLHTREDNRQNKAEEVDRLDSEYVSFMNIIQEVKRFVELIPSDSAAMARLKPLSELDNNK